MPEGITACLLFTQDGAKAMEAFASSLMERGIDVTLSRHPGQCLALLGARRWQFLVVDADGGADEGLHVLAQARWTCPEVPALVLVRQGDMETAVAAIKAGAADCIETPIVPARLYSFMDALETRADGRREDLWVRLTPVEQTILHHILNGRTNRQIADLLCRSPRTIEAHRRRIMEKLEASNLVELVKQALQAGILTEAPGSWPQECSYHHSSYPSTGA